MLGVFNWGDKPQTVAVELHRLGLPAGAVAYDFWRERLAPVSGQSLRLELPSRCCRVLALRAPAEHPQVVSTSRHVTQGIVDLVSERWDAATKTLHGVSRVVGGEPYEIRILGPASGETWQPAAARAFVQQAESRIGMEIKSPTTSLVSRVVIHSPENREVRWSVEFRRLPYVDAPKKPAAR